MTRRTATIGAGELLGGKLGPRIVDLVAQSVLATRRGLGPHEARVMAAGLQQTIDRMGEEHARFVRPLTDALLADPELPAELAGTLGRAASGEHQWEARALQGILAGQASSALGTVITNYLWPITAELVSRSPRIPPDTGTLAGLAARGFAGFGTARFAAEQQGLPVEWFTALVQMAHTWPEIGMLVELERRGVLGAGGWHNYGTIAGYNAETLPLLRALVRQYLSPADAALAVLRGNMDHGQGAAIAAKSGLDGADFDTLVANTGEPLGLMQLLEAFRRGFIDEARLERGIRQSRVRNEWIPVAKQLRYEPMSTADAADAALRGHLTQDEAQHIAALNGLRPGDWPAYYANQGNPPAPEQLLELWRRGKISRDDAHRGMREGRTRNEWIPDMLALVDSPISSADAVDAWLRGHIDHGQAEKILAENGLDKRDWPIAFANAGNPLGLVQLLEAFRRGFIDRERFIHGFRQSRYRDEWAETALELRHSPMSTAEAVEAAVQGHLAVSDARAIALENGLRPADFEPLYQTAGAPLSRTEAEQLYNRGLMSLRQVEEALRESRLKDKYVHLATELHVRLPEGRQIVAMLEFGAITPAHAIDMLLQLGYTRQVAAALVAEGEARATGGHRQLATAQITALYEQHLIDRGQAEAFLARLHYTAGTAGLLLELADHARRQRILETGVTAIRRKYLEHAASEAEARADLTALHVPSDAADLMLYTWSIERRGITRKLTEAQIVKAYKRDLWSPDPQLNAEIALERLRQLGYSPADAELLLQEV